LKIYNTLVLPKFLYGSENWTLTASQRRRIEAAEMKLLRFLACYTLYDHKTNDYIRCELQITGILDKKDEYRRNWFQHLQRMPQNRIPLKSYHYRPQGRRTIGRPKKLWREQGVQSLMFMMMYFYCYIYVFLLLSLCIFIIMYVLFCIFFFHCAALCIVCV